MPIFSTLLRSGLKRHRYCMMEWACRWCRIVKRYTSLHKLILLMNFCNCTNGWRLKRQTKWQCYYGLWPDHGHDLAIDRDRIAVGPLFESPSVCTAINWNQILASPVLLKVLKTLFYSLKSFTIKN